jgi:hypothetical protein
MTLWRTSIVIMRIPAINQLGAANPPLGQTAPHRLVLKAGAEFGHDLALGGKSQEPV